MSPPHPSWQLFIVSLPTSSATLRMRVWRAVKALGCAALRDGVYLAPLGETDTALRELSDEVNREGGSAWLLPVQAQSLEDDAQFKAMFDRSADYAEWLKALDDVRRKLQSTAAQDLNRAMRKLRRDYD